MKANSSHYEVGIAVSEPQELAHIFRRFQRLGVSVFDLGPEITKRSESKQELFEKADGYYIVYRLGSTAIHLDEQPDAIVDFVASDHGTEIRVHKPHPGDVLGWRVDDIVASQSRQMTDHTIANLLHPQFLAAAADMQV